MSQRSSLYFLDVCLPNENEPNLSVEMGILRWSAKRDDRPKVYVHTYLRPQLINRVRWTNAASMGIDKQKIVDNKRLPTIGDMIDADYLKYRHVVCFNAELEPWSKLTAQSSEVTSITSLWKEVFANNEKALECINSLNSMLEYLGIPQRDDDNKNFPALLLRLHAMAAMWFVLDSLRNPAHPRNINFAKQCSFIWPLPKFESQWFDNNPQSFSELSKEQITDFFSNSLCLRLNWNNLSMYAHDWVYNRQQHFIQSDLVGAKELADYIFNKLLSFRVKLWLLIFYALYEHKINYSREIALKGGNFEALSSAIKENFSHFIIAHLDDFLNDKQKLHLVSSLVSQSLEEKDKASFTHYDFYECAKSGPDKPVYFCYSSGPEHTNYKCFYEIRDAVQNIRYRRYAIYGQGEDRALCVDFVNKALRSFMAEAKNPFSSFWITPDLRLWIQFITGISWADYTRPTKMGDDQQILTYRRNLAHVMEEANKKYLQKLRQNLVEAIEAINNNEGYEMPPKCFNFQGSSIEIETCKRKKKGLLKRLFSFSLN